MVNLEHKLTVDDLIVEYMMYKTNNGYNPSFTTSEFVDFLHFFESKMQVDDAIYENVKLFNRFFERKNENDWFNKPHMNMIEDESSEEYFVQANYKLSNYDRSAINTYFMDNGMSKYDDFKGQAFKIRKVIKEYLANMSKRKIDETIDIDKDDLIVGKYTTAQIIQNIWESHTDKLIESQKWPRQCKDINKYLLETDISPIINLKSIKNELLELYNVISKRIAIMYHQDKNLQISSSDGSYLAMANYKLLIQGYEKLFSIAFSKYNKTLKIDLSTLTFRESHELDGIYGWDDDVDIKTTTTSIDDKNVKKLVRSLNKYHL